MIGPLSSTSGGRRRADCCERRHLLFALAAILSLAGSSGPAAATDVPFIEHTIDGSFDGTRSVYAADVDGDGDIDILGAAGAFGADDDITWWENPGGAAATDGTPWTKHIIDGSFDRAFKVYAADVDGDGDTDILGVSTHSDSRISWWENPGGAATTDGTPWTKHVIGDVAPFFPLFSVNAADVDGDGDTDILGTLFFGTSAWWENPGGVATTDGTPWTEHTIDSTNGGSSIDAADVDGDGDTDILVAEQFGNDITWSENPGGVATTDGTPWTQHTIDDSFENARWVYAADVDGDADTDILGAAQAGNSITWWENPGGAATTDASSWTEHTIDDSFFHAQSVYAADVDGDGDTDILGAAAGADDITWWENPGGTDTTNPAAWTEHTIDGSFNGATSVFAADVDGDGDTDILGAAEVDDDITWWENDTIHRNAVFPVEHTIDDSFDGAQSVYAADVDGDGDTDILGASSPGNELSWWENPGGIAATDGTTWVEHTIDDALNGGFSVRTADVDGDGDTDIVGSTSDEVIWWENPGGSATTDGTAWADHKIEDPFFSSASVRTADVDGDGDIDILAGAVREQPTWWENPGGTATTDGTPWAKHSIDSHPGSDGLTSIDAADVDGDGDIDILGVTVLSTFSFGFAWWENPGGAATTAGGTWTRHSLGGFGDSVHATDVDADGDSDIIFATSGQPKLIAWWESPGGAATKDRLSWTLHVISRFFHGASSAFGTDIDGDGDTDILGGARAPIINFTEAIKWWENPGGAATTDGTPWAEHRVSDSLNGASEVYAADVDGDGDTDILDAPSFDHVITWWENRGGQFGLPTADTSSTFLQAGTLEEVVKVTATHNGRPGDNPVELVSFDLLLEETAGDPLSDAEANALIAELRIYADDNSNGTFEPATDILVETITSLSLTAGVETIAFTDGDADVEVNFGTDRCYFVVVEAAAGTSHGSFQVTHLTLNSSTGEDAEFDIPLSLAHTAEVTAGVTLNDEPLADAGLDQMVMVLAGGTAMVTLDGSGSSDPDSDPLTFTWANSFGTEMGMVPTLSLSPGVHVVSP